MKKNLVFLSLAAVILANPIVGVRDVLPDFVAYIFLCAVLSGAAKLNDSIEEARRRFFALCFVSAGRSYIWLTFPEMADMTKLLWAFSFAIAEAVLFLPAISHFYYGLDYLLSRHGEENSTVRPESLRGYTSVFFVLRALGSFMPLLTALSGDGGSYVYDSGETVRSQFTELYTLFAIVVVTAVAAPWVIRFIRLMWRMSKDDLLMSTLHARYEKEVLAYPKKLAAQRLKTALLLLMVGCAFTVNFYIDYVNVFPNFLAAALFIACVLMLREAPVILRAFSVGASVCWGVASYFGLLLERNFVSEGYNPEKALHGIGKSEEMYGNMETASFVEGGLFILSAVLVVICVSKTLTHHARELAFSASSAEKKVKGALVPMCIAMGAVCVMNVCQTVITKYFPEVWIPSALLSVALTFAAYRVYVAAEDNLCHRMSL